MYNSRKDKYSFKGVGLFSMKKLRFSQNKDILFIFVVYFILHLFMRFISWDDPYFISALEKANYRLFSLLEKRYLCWSSRTVIELLLFFLGALPKIVWRLLDSIVISLFYCYLKKITHIFFLQILIMINFCYYVFYAGPFPPWARPDGFPVSQIHYGY